MGNLDKNHIKYAEFIPWQNEYKTNIEIIDKQHQELFEIVNTLGTHFEEVASKDIFLTFLNLLIDYTSEHFVTEEDLIYNFLPDAYEKHKQEHIVFINKVHTTLAHESTSDISHRKDLIIFLKKWLVLHILEEDVPLFNNINK